MRIALLLGSLQLGGAERQFSLLARALAEQGHQVELACLLGGGVLESELRDVKGLRLTAFSAEGGGLRLMRQARAALPTWLDERKPDVLYSAMNEANWLASARDVAAKVPVVWGVRTAQPIFSRSSAVFVRWARWRKGRVSGLIANAQAALQAYAGLGYLPKRTAVIPNGIQVERFQANPEARADARQAWGLEPDQFALAFVGRPLALKGFDLFVELVERLRVSHRQVRCVTLVPDPQQVDEEFRHRLERAGALLRSGNEIARLYPGLDGVVMPSRTEGFPNVAAEAASCGVLVRATDVGDSALLLGDARFVFPAEDAQALYEAAALMVELSQGERDAQTQQLQEHVQSEFSVAKLRDRTVDFLEGARR